MGSGLGLVLGRLLLHLLSARLRDTRVILTMACTVRIREQPSAGALMGHLEAVQQGTPCPWVVSPPAEWWVESPYPPWVMSSPAFGGLSGSILRSFSGEPPYPWVVNSRVWNVVCEVPTGFIVALWTEMPMGGTA